MSSLIERLKEKKVVQWALAYLAGAAEKAGYRVQDLILEPLASARAVLTEDEKELGVAMVELGGVSGF